jgi:hypothetical protein
MHGMAHHEYDVWMLGIYIELEISSSSVFLDHCQASKIRTGCHLSIDFQASQTQRFKRFRLQSIETMAVAQIYSIAKVARQKLLFEARAEQHNLRRLVGHANLYDVLLLAYMQHQEETGDGPLQLV